MNDERTARDLAERIKELTALHETASLLLDPDLTEDMLLARVAAVLPPAFLHASDAAGRVTYAGAVHATAGFAETPWLLRARFNTPEGLEGALEVAYLHQHAAETEGPFLAEERRLLDSLARVLSVSLDRRRAADRFRLLVNSGQIRLFEWDVVANRFVWPGIVDPGGTPRARSMSREEVRQNIHPEDQGRLWGAADAALGSPSARDFSVEYRAAFVSGDYRWRHLTARILRDAQGRAIRVVGISTDVTDQRTLQDRLRQSEKMEALGRLAGGVAHDFNNLLTAITGFAELCEGDLPESHPARPHVHEITKAAGTATALVRQILAFSRRQELKPIAADLGSLTRDAEQMLVRLLGRRISISCELMPDAPRAMVDPHQFQQVLLNLSVNARDAMPDGGAIVLRVKRRRCGMPRVDGTPAEPRDWAAVEVEDTGCGMTPAVRERIFEPFFTTKGEGKGTGLGLATVHGIVAQSGGFLEVESEVGRGTLFRAHFPACP